ncbi:FtsX-like permease family protein [Actinoplanes sp. NPDC051633]|uniref:ABC transporter permease n=1 Tax=Actinoplanes sp. NPDC051633 TaxID=3155670 RepID=UPI00341BA965
MSVRDGVGTALRLSRRRAGAVVAVLLGTAIVTATLTLLASATPVPPARFGAVAAAVQSPAVSTPADPFPESRPWSPAEAEALRSGLARAPGVTAAVSDRTFYAQPVIGGRPWHIDSGHGWTSAALAPHGLVAGRAPAADGELVLGRSAGAGVGGTVTVLTAEGPAPWVVVGLIDADAVYTSDAVAARLSPGVRVIALLGDPRLPPIGSAGTVLSSDELGALEPRADARTRWIGMQVVTAMVALASFACVFIIASTFALSVRQRRRELGMLRAVGATPRQVRRMVLREAAAVGVVASVAGSIVGLLAAPLLGPVLVDAGFEPSTFVARPHLWPIAVGIAAGPVIAVLGSAVAARRAAGVSPLEALREAAVQTRPMTRTRWIVGGAFAAVSLATGLATTLTDEMRDLATYSLLSAMSAVVAATLLAPVVVPPVVRLVLWPLRGPIAMVARESALTAVGRTASIAAPVLLTIAFAVFIAGNVKTSSQAFADRRAAQVQAGAVLTPDGTPGLTDAAVSSAAGAAILPTDVYVGDSVARVIGVDPSMATVLAGLRDAAGRLSGDAAIVTESRAAQSRVRTGQTLTVRFEDGQDRQLSIVGTVPDSAVPAEFVLSRSTVRAHDPSALASAVLLPEGRAPAPPVGSRVISVDEFARSADANEDHLVWTFTVLLIAVSVGYGLISVANTLMMATAGRAGDLRLLRLAGATPRQVLLAVATESAVIVVIGSLMGLAAAELALWGSARGLSAQIGQEVASVFPWTQASAAVAACLLLAVLASIGPAARWSRRPALSAPDLTTA